jgi:hypothetical protein
MARYELSVLERLILMRVLQSKQQGSFTTLRIVRDLENELSFSESEHAALQFREEGSAIRWNPEAAQAVKAVEIGDKAAELIRSGFEELDKQQALRVEFLPLCEMFGYEGLDDA